MAQRVIYKKTNTLLIVNFGLFFGKQANETPPKGGRVALIVSRRRAPQGV